MQLIPSVKSPKSFVTPQSADKAKASYDTKSKFCSAEGSAWLGTFASNSLILACGVATGVFAARLLLPEGRGQLAVMLLWPQVIAVLGFVSLHEAMAYRLAQSIAVVNKAIVTSGLCIAGMLAVLWVIVGYNVLPYLLGSERADWIPLAQTYCALLIPANFLTLAILGAHHGRRHYKAYNAVRLLPSAVYLLGLVTLWLFEWVSVTAAVWASLVGTIAALAASLYSIRRELWGRPSLIEVGELLAFGKRAHVVTILALLCSTMDRGVVSLAWNDAAIGIFMVALTVASSGLAVVTESFQITLFPTLAAEVDPGRQRDALAATLRQAVALLSLGILVLIVVVPWLVPLLFGPTFSSAIVITQVLLIAYFPAALRQIAAHALKALGDTGAATVSEGVVVASFLLVVGPLAWKFELVGVAIAVLLSNVLSIAYAIRKLSQRIGLRGGQWLTMRALKELGYAARFIATRLIARNER